MAQTKDAGGIEYDMAYYSASGRHMRYSFLGQRFEMDAGFRPDRGECWIAWVAPEGAGLRATFKWMYEGWYTALWRSPEDRVWVTESQGSVFEFARPDSDYKKHELPSTLFGIYGLSEHEIYVWGERNYRPAMFRWDGRGWTDIPAPPFAMDCMHGLSTHDLWVSGADGGVARWDGSAWRPLATRTQERIVSIFVAGPDELYGCGNRGSIFEGSQSGWTRIGGIPDTETGDVQAVAKWNGDLWIACSRLGLWKRIGKTDQFDRYKPRVDAVSIDVRDGIVVACKHLVASSADGVGFMATAMEHLLNDRANKLLGQP
ncbi:MAG: hypothetical protein IT379_35390 [Deltaproteobacteria bacterium]|nr:hypothetical protein [Deltaproteobacteria bacterium]